MCLIIQLPRLSGYFLENGCVRLSEVGLYILKRFIAFQVCCVCCLLAHGLINGGGLIYEYRPVGVFTVKPKGQPSESPKCVGRLACNIRVLVQATFDLEWMCESRESHYAVPPGNCDSTDATNFAIFAQTRDFLRSLLFCALYLTFYALFTQCFP